MNDELLHMALLAAYANMYLSEARMPFPPMPELYAARFLPEGSAAADGETAWFAHLARSGCRELTLAFEYGAEDWARTAFANGVAGWEIVCRYDSGVRGWRRYWENRLADGAFRWFATYTENAEPLAHSFKERIGAQARFEHLQALLGMLASLSGAIHAYDWKARFTAMHDDMDYFRSRKLIDASELPRAFSDEARKLFAASRLAWVFGGMGSWNDEPSALATRAGMETMYNDLTGELYTAVLNCLRCAVGKENIEI